MIVKKYLRTYFVFDVLATLPMWMIEQNDEVGRIGNVLRISRLTRIIYIFRAFKFMKITKLFTSKTSVSFQVKYRGLIRLTLFFFVVLVILHFSA